MIFASTKSATARFVEAGEAGLQPSPAPRAAHDVAILEVSDLKVEFDTPRGVVRAVDGVSWSVNPGEIVALVGESGCGKSVSALAIMRLLGRPAGRIVGGSIRFEGRDLLALTPDEMRTRRGKSLSMIFQEPMSSLNPLMTIGDQVMEPLKLHLGMTDGDARTRARELLAKVGITDAERRLEQYPHHLSGGMRQRVMIAMGIACNPKLIIADEPTTALDVTIQAQILELMKSLSREMGISLVIITHNLGIVARYVDRVNVMYAGRIVESGPVDHIFARPTHPYTIGLLNSVPRLDRGRRSRLATIEGSPPNLLHPPAGCRFSPRCEFRIALCEVDPDLRATDAGTLSACHRAHEMAHLRGAVRPEAVALARMPVSDRRVLSVRDLRKSFPIGKGSVVHAVDGVSFDLHEGETLGLVGESGCGKTTVGRTILRLTDPTDGSIRFEEKDLAKGSAAALTDMRRRMQVVFQDPLSSLNPRMTVGQILAEPLGVHRIVSGRKAIAARVEELLEQVGLLSTMAERYPHQLSGGQRQRVGIARALSMEPKFIVLDEPVSALDVSIQGQIINLLESLQSRLGISFLFIAHDLAVVRHISHRVLVMYLGRVMEIADRDTLYDAPLHPYTKALLNAAPIPDPVIERSMDRKPLRGELPSPLSAPSGCVFRTRCPIAEDICADIVPELVQKAPGHSVACVRV